jgi:hypothetical protein
MAYVLDLPVRDAVKRRVARRPYLPASRTSRRLNRVPSVQKLAAIAVGGLLIAGTAAAVTIEPRALDASVPNQVLSASAARGSVPEGARRAFPVGLTVQRAPVRPAKVAIRRAPAVAAVHHQVVEASYVPTANSRATQSGWGCGPALAWLGSHAAPGFSFECPGYAMGHQAMTCQNTPGVCPGARIIVIAIPCPAAYMNEAYNSWIIARGGDSGYDPYGYCG